MHKQEISKFTTVADKIVTKVLHPGAYLDNPLYNIYTSMQKPLTIHLLYTKNNNMLQTKESPQSLCGELLCGELW
jgi:hypothetical protein